jgi:hypothetical protein
MITKTEQAVVAFKNGNIKQAFKMMFRFHGFSQEEKRYIQVAYECLAGKEDFYISLGIDTNHIINKAIECVSAKYNVTPTLLQR